MTISSQATGVYLECMYPYVNPYLCYHTYFTRDLARATPVLLSWSGSRSRTDADDIFYTYHTHDISLKINIPLFWYMLTADDTEDGLFVFWCMVDVSIYVGCFFLFLVLVGFEVWSLRARPPGLKKKRRFSWIRNIFFRHGFQKETTSFHGNKKQAPPFSRFHGESSHRMLNVVLFSLNICNCRACVIVKWSHGSTLSAGLDGFTRVIPPIIWYIVVQ